MNRSAFLAAAVAAFGVVIGAMNPAQAKDPPGELRVEGTIVAKGLASATMRTQQGALVTVIVNSATKIERNGVEVPFTAIRVGDFGQARYNGSTMIARKLESRGP